MGTNEFIKEIAPLVQKYAPQYGIKVCSPIIAQAVLESDSGTSDKVKKGSEWRHNYLGLKWRDKRCAISNDYFEEYTREQLKDGTYITKIDKFCKFKSLEDCVIGYFQWLNIPRYENIKGVTDYKKYIELLRKDGYATDLKYIEKILKAVDKYNLTQYDKIESKDTMTIKKKLANKANYGSKRDTKKIKYIVIHYTANDGDSDEGNGNYFANNIVKASAHYFVDDDSITQSVPDDYIAYSVGGSKYSNGGGRLYGKATNSNTISIELCDSKKDGVIKATDKTINNAIQLVKDLMKKYSIKAENVIRHYDVNGKPCPKYWVDDSKWKKEFWDKLGSAKTETKVETKTEPKSFLVQVLVADLNIRGGAGTNYPIKGVIRDKGKYTIVETNGSWGKLKSGAGWINISSKYCKRL